MVAELHSGLMAPGLKIGGMHAPGSALGICMRGRLGNRPGSRPVISATLRHRVHFVLS
jgi:hypothetical protein